jgi:GNAT superfamily N-acetyltransferase
MSNEAASIEIWRANTLELETAFALVEEYFARADVVSREGQEEFSEEYFGDGRGFWLARSETKLAGCIGLRILSGTTEREREKASCAEIKRMYVREKFRAQGIAQKLLEAAEHFARGAGYDWIYLDTTNEMRAAARLYERNGYQRCERYNDNSQATIFMRKKLEVTS